MKVYGIDFSSAPSKTKPIAVAECWLTGSLFLPKTKKNLFVSRLIAIDSLEMFQKFLSQRGPWIGGFDLPFSMPRDLIEFFRWPTCWDKFISFYCSQEKETLKTFFKAI